MRHHQKLDHILVTAKDFLRDNDPRAKKKKEQHSHCSSKLIKGLLSPPKKLKKLDKAMLFYNIPELADNKYGSAVIRSNKLDN